MNYQRNIWKVIQLLHIYNEKLHTGKIYLQIKIIAQYSKLQKYEHSYPRKTKLRKSLKNTKINGQGQTTSYDGLTHQFIQKSSWELLQNLWKPNKFQIKNRLDGHDFAHYQK
ncbi:unnamed protein product [Paramecium octaurelia]|uniref:Uncharacterized protein n=1 Tax=Paramecium octaurelia TaxID=43137 RepID=A0A8S1W5R3_PAROT|nr:unnamed protein product [Paramecium octaurelia]